MDAAARRAKRAKELQEKKEEEPSTHPSGPSLFNLIHKKLEKETFKARSAASKKAAQTMKKRRASGKDDYDDDIVLQSHPRDKDKSEHHQCGHYTLLGRKKS